jgi:tRNA threonylcarbamoyladenosine biosynthesis protein TsaB
MPLVGIPTLEIVAAAMPQRDGELVVVAEAGRTRITTATYHWQRRGGWQTSDRPVNETWAELLDRLEPPVVIAGEISPAALKQIRVAGRGYQAVAAPARVRRAAVLADLAWQRLRRGDVDDPAQLTPLYLREP